MPRVFIGWPVETLKRRLIVSLAAVLAALLIFGAIWLAAGQRSYEHPGPASAAVGLALVVMLVGLALQDFQTKNSRLTEQLAESRLALQDFQRKHSELTEQLAESQLALHDIQDKNSELIKQIAQLHEISESPVRLPQIIGLELLVNRWCLNGRALTSQDGAALFEQIRIALTVARRDFGNDGALRFIKAFPGTKVERGVFHVQAGRQMPRVLKFDTVANISRETVNNNLYVENNLNVVPGIPKPCHGQGMIGNEPWSAVSYNLLGASNLSRVQTFGDFYRTHDSQAITSFLQDHVFAALSHWWDNPQPPMIPTLYEEYERIKDNRKKDDRIENNRTKAKAAICELGDRLDIGSLKQIDDSIMWLDLQGIPSLRNPVNWIKDVFENEKLGTWATNLHLRYDSIVHGDFHAGNLLVSEDQNSLQAWLIDFPHTHIGPTVQDIARLEADIKFWLMPATSDYKVLYDWESALLPPPTRPEPGAEAIRLGMTSPDSQLQKDWSVIYLLREQARAYIHDCAYNYYLALLYATLPILYYRDRTDAQKLHSLISAALLCERLGG